MADNFIRAFYGRSYVDFAKVRVRVLESFSELQFTTWCLKPGNECRERRDVDYVKTKVKYKKWTQRERTENCNEIGILTFSI